METLILSKTRFGRLFCIGGLVLANNRFVRNQNGLRNFLLNRNLLIWQGSILNLYNGLLQWTTQGSGYFKNQNNFPPNSVGFWIPEYNLTYENENEYYHYPDPVRKIKYVGVVEPLEEIPAGTLIRVSLAKWWPDPNDQQKQHIPRGCYLQLSAWYL